MKAELTTKAFERKFVDLVLDDVEQDGSFSGYASLFGQVDLGKDVVERGAFTKSLKAKGAGGIRMLFQHDPAEPIGLWTEVKEDARGLFVRGRLARDVRRSREVLSLMRGGALDGLSIGFRTVRARKDAASGVRRILEADLWEISIVTFPMLPQARVESVKGRRGRLPTIREFEGWLTRDAGLSRSDARAIVAKGFASLLSERDAARSATGLGGMIREAIDMMKIKGNHIDARSI